MFLDYLIAIKDEKIFLIISTTLAKQFIPFIHDKPQLDSIYIFTDDRSIDELWTTEWPKVKTMSTKIELICNSLQTESSQCDGHLIPISIVYPNDYAIQD